MMKFLGGFILSLLGVAFVGSVHAEDGCYVNQNLCPSGSHLYCVRWDSRLEATVTSCDGVTKEVILPCVPGPENSNCGHGGT